MRQEQVTLTLAEHLVVQKIFGISVGLGVHLFLLVQWGRVMV